MMLTPCHPEWNRGISAGATTGEIPPLRSFLAAVGKTRDAEQPSRSACLSTSEAAPQTDEGRSKGALYPHPAPSQGGNGHALSGTRGSEARRCRPLRLSAVGRKGSGQPLPEKRGTQVSPMERTSPAYTQPQELDTFVRKLRLEAG